MTDTDKYEGSKGSYMTGKMIDNYLNMQVEIKRLREAIADIANNMEAADASYMGGFIEDLRKVIE